MCVCVFWHWPRLVIDNIASMCVCVLALASVGYCVCVCVCVFVPWLRLGEDSHFRCVDLPECNNSLRVTLDKTSLTADTAFFHGKIH